MMFLLLFVAIVSCDKEETAPKITEITLSASTTTVQANNVVYLSVTTDTDVDITNDVRYVVNGTPQTSSEFTPNTFGDFRVIATYSINNRTLESNDVIITATAAPLTSVTLGSDSYLKELGQVFTLSVIGDNDVNHTADASFFVDGVALTDNTYTATSLGEFTATATYNHNGTTLTADPVTLEVKGNPTTVKFFDEIVFYDGYAAVVSDPVPPGVIRKSNDTYFTKIEASDISQISGDELEIEIIIGALCDNYDRGGHLFLNTIAKNTTFDVNNVVDRFEIARFITPFMNKNRMPDEVPYNYDANNIAKILNDTSLNAAFDFYLEFRVFGVPYAANTQVSGCAGRNDVFRGTVNFKSTNANVIPVPQAIEPICSDAPLNNYSANATDVMGQTTRTFNINLNAAINAAQLVVITSNHGANTGGEEYNRRQHFIYFDNINVDTYIPGGKSCEPYRRYNTQGNGIYQSTPQPLSYWTSFNNWCPGDAIPTRVYNLGNLAAGAHSFKIEVPDAEFVDGQGNIPTSAYIYGDL